jgi:hypothetical protein
MPTVGKGRRSEVGIVNLFPFDFLPLKEPVELLLVVDEHLSGFRAVVGADNAGLFELVDNAGGPRVPDGELALKEGDGALLSANGDPGRLLELVVGVVHAEVAARAVAGIHEGGQFVGSHARLLGDEVDDLLYFLNAHEGALEAPHIAAAEEEHVAIADQALGAALVKDGAGVGHGGHFVGDARREVGLDDAGNHVHRRALRGEDQVDAHGPGHLGKARNGAFDVVAHRHHEVGEFVDHHDDVRHVAVPVLGR